MKRRSICACSLSIHYTVHISEPANHVLRLPASLTRSQYHRIRTSQRDEHLIARLRSRDSASDQPVPRNEDTGPGINVVNIARSSAKTMARYATKLCNSSSCSNGLILWLRPKDSDTAAAVRKDLVSGKVPSKLAAKVWRLRVHRPLILFSPPLSR